MKRKRLAAIAIAAVILLLIVIVVSLRNTPETAARKFLTMVYTVDVSTPDDPARALAPYVPLMTAEGAKSFAANRCQLLVALSAREAGCTVAAGKAALKAQPDGENFFYEIPLTLRYADGTERIETASGRIALERQDGGRRVTWIQPDELPDMTT